MSLKFNLGLYLTCSDVPVSPLGPIFFFTKRLPVCKRLVVTLSKVLRSNVKVIGDHIANKVLVKRRMCNDLELNFNVRG